MDILGVHHKTGLFLCILVFFLKVKVHLMEIFLGIAKI